MNNLYKFALIFRRFLIELVTESTFKLYSRLVKQVDGCTVGGLLSVTFSDIYLVRMENDFVIPSKLIFYCRFLGDIYSRRKLGDTVLFNRLHNYHPNIELTVEVNPSKFSDTKLTKINCAYKFNVYLENTKKPSP